MANKQAGITQATAVKSLLMLAALALPLAAGADSSIGIQAFNAAPAPGGGTSYTLPIQTMLLMTALTFIPAALLLMTSFTRIIIVLSLLRQALGTQSAPPNQVIVGLSLFLTLFVMGPTFDKVYTEAYLPYSNNQISFQDAYKKAESPLRTFMLKQTRETDLGLFARLGNRPATEKAADLPLNV